MEFRSAGKLFLISTLLLTAACIIPSGDKPINPRLAFTSGKSFLNDATVLALKGHIEFNDGRSIQSGSFEMFLAGRDSLAFRIEGPLGLDVFRMYVIDTTAYLYSNSDEGWVTLGRMERASIAEYGIDNISPFETGLVIIPQYYVDSFTELGERALTLKTGSHDYQCAIDSDNRKFTILANGNELISEYSQPHAIGESFYPSCIKISSPDSNWAIRLHIENIRVNPRIPSKIWERQ